MKNFIAPKPATKRRLYEGTEPRCFASLWIVGKPPHLCIGVGVK